MSTILCDVDDVVCLLLPRWLALYNADYRDAMTVEDCTDWDLHTLVAPECGVKIYDYLKRPDLYDDCLPVPYAVWGVQALRAAGHRVVFVTAGGEGRKYPWLVRHGLLPEDRASRRDYVEALDKSLVAGDLIIDDRVSTIQDFPGATILFDRPHNRQYHGSPRAHDWQEVVHLTVGFLATHE